MIFRGSPSHLSRSVADGLLLPNSSTSASPAERTPSAGPRAQLCPAGPPGRVRSRSASHPTGLCPFTPTANVKLLFNTAIAMPHNRVYYRAEPQIIPSMKTSLYNFTFDLHAIGCALPL